jgi:type I restriction enzyme R subunit
VVGGEAYYPALSGAELMPYKERVRAVVLQHFASAPVLLRLKARKAVTEAEIEELARLILEIDDRADLKRLAAHDPVTRGSLASTLRGLVGLEPEAVEEAFVDFLSKHPSMTAKQTQFLARLQEHIAKNGGMEVDRLFEEPFTQMEALFPENDVDAILGIVEQFSLLPPSERVE